MLTPPLDAGFLSGTVATDEVHLACFDSQIGEGVTAPTSTLKPKVTSDEGKGDPPEGPFILSEAQPVIPAKLVRRILRAEYVDMAELLKDNMEVERRRMLTDSGTAQAHFTNRQARRDILSWLQCFSMYAAVVVSEHPGKIRELLAYQAMMIGEARRCGGRGWLLYDAAFRQQIRSYDTMDFAKINQSLYSTTFLAYGGGRPRFCPDCMMADHSHEECALHPNRALPVVQMRDAAGGRPKAQEVWRKRERSGVCYAWNDGKCSFTRCRYDHVCARCGGEHKKAQCRDGDRRKDRGSE